MADVSYDIEIYWQKCQLTLKEKHFKLVPSEHQNKYTLCYLPMPFECIMYSLKHFCKIKLGSEIKYLQEYNWKPILELSQNDYYNNSNATYYKTLLECGAEILQKYT